MLLYLFLGKCTKYAIEAIHLHAASLSPCLREELQWSRVVNTQGVAGRNIPSDLFMEHLIRTLKDCQVLEQMYQIIQSYRQASHLEVLWY